MWEQPKLTLKQQNFVKAFRSGKYRFLMAAGSAGSGKSIVCIGLIDLLCANIRDLRFAIIRKSEKNLKDTTLPSYRKFKGQDMTRTMDEVTITGMRAKYHRTGSEIVFIWADTSKDPDLDNLKGIELTGALIEEANQVDIRYFNLLKTRIGRWNNDKCRPFILLNMNPSPEWPKEVFYEPWVNGKLEAPYYFEEFSVTDNPTLNEEYVKGLDYLPEEEYKRYVLNRWDYQDNPAQLIKYEWYKQCAKPLDELPDPDKSDRYQMSIDPAWEGSDRTVFAFMWGNTIGRYEEFRKQDPDVGGDVALHRAQERNILPSDTIVDAVGLGAGIITAMKKGITDHNNHVFKMTPIMFKGGASPVDQHGYYSFQDCNAEAAWLLRENLKAGDINIQHTPQVQKEILAVEYSTTNKIFRTLPKKEFKKKHHFSPDYFDAIKMIVWNYHNSSGRQGAEILERMHQERIASKTENNTTVRQRRRRRASNWA